MNNEQILVKFLNCGFLDLKVLEDTKFDVMEIISEIERPTLNDIICTIFQKGNDEFFTRRRTQNFKLNQCYRNAARQYFLYIRVSAGNCYRVSKTGLGNILLTALTTVL